MSSAPVTPRDQIIDDYVDFFVPYGKDKDGKLITCMEPLFPISAAKPDEEALKKPVWTRPPNWTQMHVVMPPDDPYDPNGNIEKDLEIDNFLDKIEEEFPGVSDLVGGIIENCEVLSTSNAVLVLHYLRLLKEKGVFKDKPTFTQIIAVCKMSFDYLEDENPYKSRKDVDEIFWTFFKALGYNLTVSKETFDSICKECNEECNK